jgi:hypothetical protein
VRLLNTPFLLASQTRAFWKVRALLTRLGFLGHRRLFGVGTRIRENRTRASTLLTLGRLTIGQVVVAITIAIMMQKGDSFLDGFYNRYGLTITPDIYGTLLGTITGS